MGADNHIPSKSYGILQQESAKTTQDKVAEQIKNLGYAVLDSGYNASEIQKFSDEFNRIRTQYIALHGESKLRDLDELNTIRLLLTHGGNEFLKLALNESLLSAINKLINGKYILNQQNGVINPPQETYNQGAWHRDFPYQHFVTTKPLAINAPLFKL